jgi:methionyl aminopeptidase
MKIILISAVAIITLLLLYLIFKNKVVYFLQTNHEELPSSEIVEESKILGKKLSDIILVAKNSIRPNRTTQELNSIISNTIKDSGYKPAMLGFNDFPAESCISINEQVLHHIPNQNKIVEGDLITIQTAIKGRYAFANQGWTFILGTITPEKQNLYKKGIEALKNAINIIKPNINIGDISYTIQSTIENAGYFVNKEFVGYAMGTKMMQAPEIPCNGKPGKGIRVEKGMILNIHVIASMGSSEIYQAEDTWGIFTTNHLLSVLFSAMVMVEENKAVLLSKFLN